MTGLAEPIIVLCLGVVIGLMIGDRLWNDGRAVFKFYMAAKSIRVPKLKKPKRTAYQGGYTLMDAMEKIEPPSI